MSKYFVDGQDLTDIADAIREGLATTESLEFPDDFINGIEDLGGGITPTGTKEIAVTANTTSTTDIETYKYVKIVSNVPNSYSAGDEGKVVQSGSLVAQSAMTASTNDTYDTTLYNSVVVAVPTGGFTPADEGKVVYNGALVAQTSGSVNTDGTYDTTLINSFTVNVGGGGGGSSYTTGTITPSERTYSITFDTGLSTIHGIVIVPTDESPLKSNGRTMYGLIALDPGTTMIKSIALGSNNTGSSASVITPSNSATRFSQTGTSVMVNTQGVGSGYYWEAVTYTWYAW